MTTPLNASCLCGETRFTAIPQSTEAGTCHCGMCRKFSGGMFIGVQCGDTVSFQEGAPVVVYRSSDWGERLFCGTCGSTIAWRSVDGKMTAVSVQLFDDPGQFPVKSEIFYDDKPSSYALVGETHKMTGAEVMAAFSGNGEGA